MKLFLKKNLKKFDYFFLKYDSKIIFILYFSIIIFGSLLFAYEFSQRFDNVVINNDNNPIIMDMTDHTISSKNTRYNTTNNYKQENHIIFKDSIFSILLFLINDSSILHIVTFVGIK